MRSQLWSFFKEPLDLAFVPAFTWSLWYIIVLTCLGVQIKEKSAGLMIYGLWDVGSQRRLDQLRT